MHIHFPYDSYDFCLIISLSLKTQLKVCHFQKNVLKYSFYTHKTLCWKVLGAALLFICFPTVKCSRPMIQESSYLKKKEKKFCFKALESN